MNTKNLFKSLFSEAEKQGSLHYIFTLLRVEGYNCKNPDPLIELNTILNTVKINKLSKNEIINDLQMVFNLMEEPFSVIYNLINCSGKKEYQFNPFFHLYTGEFPDRKKPHTYIIIEELINYAIKTGNINLANLVQDTFSEYIIKNIFNNELNINLVQAKKEFKKIRDFFVVFLENYFSERLKYLKFPKFIKLPRFEVLELLTNKEVGLFGFNIHFSNGNSATFIRNLDSTENVNISLDPISIFIGDKGKLKDEWHIGEKRLHEIGLSGRYNELGEWKPIVFPGDFNPLDKEAHELSDDPDVQGIIFYILTTGYRVIEFVVRTSISLPLDNISFGDRLHLWKCQPLESISSENLNFVIYDGWYELASIEPDDIRTAITTIGIGINRLAFIYNSPINWRLKYGDRGIHYGCAKPSKNDLKILNKILKDFPLNNDAIILDAALDWYNRGRSSKNIFMSFLSYYIAIESVCIAVAENRAELGLEYSREPRSDRRKNRIECIDNLYITLYEKDPIEFVETAYFECIQSLKEKTKKVTELVFGPDHDYIKVLFNKTSDGYSLSDIRGKLAHGGITLIDWKDESLVRNRIYEIEKISNEFIIRIIFGLKPSDHIPSWSQEHFTTVITSDPRMTHAVTRLDAFPNKDWRIKPEWCE